MTPPRPGDAVDPLFLEFLRLGPRADFEAFCAKHREHAAHLRTLHTAHLRALAHLEAAGLSTRSGAPAPRGRSSLAPKLVLGAMALILGLGFGAAAWMRTRAELAAARANAAERRAELERVAHQARGAEEGSGRADDTGNAAPGDAAALREFLVGILAGTDPEPVGTAPGRTLREVLARAAADLDAKEGTGDPETECALRTALGHGLSSAGEPEEARRQWARALELRRQIDEGESLAQSALQDDLARVEVTLGELDTAQESAQHALETRRQLLGDHRDTASALAILADVEDARGNRAEARRLDEEALEMRRTVLPAGDPAIGDSLRRLGELAHADGDLPSAERLYVEAESIWTESLADDRPELANLWLDLGRVLRSQGRWDEAREKIEAALNQRTARSGATSPSANEARDELIALLLDAEDYGTVEVLAQEALDRLASEGPGDERLRAFYGAQLGSALLGQNRFDEAEALLLAGRTALSADPGAAVEDKLFVVDQLARLYSRLGSSEEAEKYRLEAARLRH